MSAIRNVFAKLKEQGSGVLIGYITAGDPTQKHTIEIAEALIRGGVDIIELGLPFSDPIADGPTIQKASARALKAGTTPRIVLEMAKQIRQNNDAPLVIMTYFNPVFRMGLEKFLRTAEDCKVDGIVIPDLPVEEANTYRKVAAECCVDTIFLAAPSTTDERLRRIVDCSSGFLYLVSRFGVTGVKSTVQDSAIQLIKRVLMRTRGIIPLAVGFGVSKPEHVKNIIGAGADGAIVGSVFIDLISRYPTEVDMKEMLARVEGKARALKQATWHSAITSPDKSVQSKSDRNTSNY